MSHVDGNVLKNGTTICSILVSEIIYSYIRYVGSAKHANYQEYEIPRRYSSKVIPEMSWPWAILWIQTMIP